MASFDCSIAPPSPLIPATVCTTTEFTTAPVDVAAIIGEQVYLFCDYPGSASEAWSTDNGVAIQLSPPNLCNCIPQANGTGSALYFPQVGSGDYKNYTCSAQIGFGVSCRVTAAIRAAGEWAYNVSVYTFRCVDHNEIIIDA